MKRGTKKAPKSGASKFEERQPTTKKPRKSKCMNKKEGDNLVDSINSVEPLLLTAIVNASSGKQTLTCSNTLCKNDSSSCDETVCHGASQAASTWAG